MALIKCPECQGQVSDKAAACPHCGYAGERASRSFTVDENHARESYKAQKKRLQKKRLGFVAAFFAVIMVMGFFAETQDDKGAGVADNTVQPAESNKQSAILAAAVNENPSVAEPQEKEVSAGQEEVEVASESISMSFEECQAAKGSVIAKLNVPPQNVVPVINTSLVTITRVFADDGSVLITCSSADNKMIITQSSVTR